MSGVVLALSCAAASALMTGVVWRLAPRWRLLDIPNVRSSHQHAVPRGGGLAVVVTVLITALGLALGARLAGVQALVWMGGGALIAAVGFLDDRGGLSVRTRLLVQLIVALAVVWSSDPRRLVPGGVLVHLAAWIAAALAVMWAINLFNFMDGIDGLAAQQAVFVAAAALWLGAGPPASPVAPMLYAIAGATAGFLVWNWAPARIFLGDVGSGFLGFALALAALTGSRDHAATLWVWLILQGAFVVDASVTVCVRLLRREPVYAAHRQHAYQRLARHWHSHARVSLAYLAVNLAWLLPLAAAAAARPQLAPWVALAALSPLAALALHLGAGRAGEISPRAAIGKASGEV